MNKRVAQSNAPDLLVIGKITGAHGLAGNLKVWSFAESSGTFAKGRTIFLRNEDASGLDKFCIQKVSERKKGLLLNLAGITDRNLADELIGKEILIPRSTLPEPEKDTWYWQDLYGLHVWDDTLGGLGTVDSIFPTGAHDVLVVKAGGKEVMIPMHRQFVAEVDLGAGIIRTCLPDGFEAV